MATTSAEDGSHSTKINYNDSAETHATYKFIVEIKCNGKSPTAANSLIARGAFGQVDISILVRRQHPSSEHNGSYSKIHSVSLAAIKTIPYATTKSGTSQQNASLTREAFAELNSLRLLNGHENVTPLLGFYGAQDSSDGGGFGGWDWAEDYMAVMSPSSLCLVFPYHPIDLHEALVYRRFHPSSKFASDAAFNGKGSSCSSSYFLPKSVVQSVMHDVLSALHHLHSHCILHRDVKPGNLYITREGRVQIGDFGLAKIVAPSVQPESRDQREEYNFSTNTGNTNLTQGLCTLQYRPPEMLLGGTGIVDQTIKTDCGVNGAFDIFSAGCIFAELLTLSGPIFPGQSVLDQLGRIFQILGTPSNDNWPGVSLLPDWNKVSFESTNETGLRERIGRQNLTDELEVLTKMLVLDPLQRFSARDCLALSLLLPFNNSCQEHMTKARNSVVSSLLPTHMQIMDPVYFAANEDNQNYSLVFAKQYALKRAASRRNFVSDLSKRNIHDTIKRWTFGT